MLPHKVWVLADGLRDGAEDDALLCQLSFESGRDGLRVKDVVVGHILDSRQPLLLVDGDAQLAEGLQQLWVHLIQAFLQEISARELCQDWLSSQLAAALRGSLFESAHEQQGTGTGTAIKPAAGRTSRKDK